MEDDFTHRFDKSMAGKHHARFIDESTVYHVISRAFQGRCLFQPCDALNAIVIGVVAKALALYANIELYSFVLLSNHLHAMLKGPPEEVVRFIAYTKREISRRWGGEINWPNTMWEEYVVTALPTPQSQIDCMKYVLSQGVKEGLVARPEDWPGVHCAAALMAGKTLEGQWFDATGYGRALDAANRTQKPKTIKREDYTRTVAFTFNVLPALAHLGAAEQQVEIKKLVDNVVSDAEADRRLTGTSVMGAEAVKNVPHTHISQLTPPLWFTKRRRRMLHWADPRDPLVRHYIARYWEFQHAYREAADRFNTGDLTVEFPLRAFRPPSHRRATKTGEADAHAA